MKRKQPENAPGNAIETMKRNYISLINLDGSDDADTFGTGVIISPTRVLTCCHAVQMFQRTRCKDLPDLPGKIVEAMPEGDLLLIEFRGANFSPGELKFPRKIEQGDNIHVFGNARNMDRVYQRFIIAKIGDEDDDKDIVYIFPRMTTGDSGAGAYNDKGELIGIVSFNVMDTETTQALIAGLISYKAVRKFLKDAKPQHL